LVGNKNLEDIHEDTVALYLSLYILLKEPRSLMYLSLSFLKSLEPWHRLQFMFTSLEP